MRSRGGLSVHGLSTSLFREAAIRARDFVLEPAPAARPVPALRLRSRTEVVVLGLSTGCGTTTVARGLALALRAPGGHPSLLLAPGDAAGNGTAAAGVAALVWDAGSSDVTLARGIAHHSDAVVLVAGKTSEPALAEITADVLREDFDRVVLVANRVTDHSRWNSRADLCIPGSWFGAALLGRGRRPPGAFGAALARLATIVRDGNPEAGGRVTAV
jgi:hypothetical protein